MRSANRGKGVLCIPVVLVLSIGSVTACAQDEPTITDVDADVDKAGSNEAVEESTRFFDDPAAIVGEHVAVSATVDEIVDAEGFVIVERGREGGDRYLVVHDGEVSLEQGADVEVTGTVIELDDVAELEREQDIELDDETYEPYEGDHVIAADTVELVG